MLRISSAVAFVTGIAALALAPPVACLSIRTARRRSTRGRSRHKDAGGFFDSAVADGTVPIDSAPPPEMDGGSPPVDAPAEAAPVDAEAQAARPER